MVCHCKHAALCHSQPEDVEESTGIVYPHQDQEKMRGPQPDPSAMAMDANTSRELVKSGLTQIHVTYDRIEPETGESENVAVVDVHSASGRGGKEAEPVSMEEGEVVSSEEGEERGRPGQQGSVMPAKTDRDSSGR